VACGPSRLHCCRCALPKKHRADPTLETPDPATKAPDLADEAIVPRIAAVTRGYREAAAAFLAPAQASWRNDPAVVRWRRERVDDVEIGASPVPPACGRREVNIFFFFGGRRNE